MKTHPSNKLFYKLGKSLGQPLGWVLRKEQNFAIWLVTKGISKPLVKVSLAFIRFSIIGLLIYFSINVAVVIGIVFGLLLLSKPSPKNNNAADSLSSEYGPQGYGLYTRNGFRVDGGEEDN